MRLFIPDLLHFNSWILGLLPEVDAELPSDSGITCHGVNWTAAILHSKHVRLVVVVAYFENGLGPVGSNERMMTEIEALLKTLGMLYLILDDWNFSPDALVASGSLWAALGGSGAFPTGSRR